MMHWTIDRSAAVLLGVLFAAPLAGQDGSPLANAVLAGYGTAGYTTQLDEDFANEFTASVSPILLFRMGENLLFETELEFGYEGGVTSTTLEYAQVDYLGFERLQLTAGKFLLPFGVFGERLHPSWINRMPDMPLLFGHAHGGVAEGSLLPVLSDIGAMARWNQPLGSGNLALSLLVTQGPQLVVEDGLDPDAHAHALRPAESSRSVLAGTGPGEGSAAVLSVQAADVPGVAWGVAVPDNNSNKMLGARIGYVARAGFEAYVSGFHAMYDADDYLDMVGVAVSVMARRGPWDLIGEGVVLRQEFILGTTGEYENLTSPGYYLQLARRFGDFEPVARWSHLLEPKVDATAIGEERRELGLGLNYWITPSIPLKAAYTLTPDGDDRMALQWAFGF